MRVVRHWFTREVVDALLLGVVQSQAGRDSELLI